MNNPSPVSNPAAEAPVRSPIGGTSTFMIGPTGVGKTYAIRTLVEAGITPFVISTEPGIESTLGDVPDPQIHWHYIPPTKASWDSMISQAQRINTMTMKALAGMPAGNRQEHAQWLEVLRQCNDFTCQRCGESFGSVDTWGTDRALVVDSMSGLAVMAMSLVIGDKPMKAVGDWGIAMSRIEEFITRLCTSLRCWLVVTAHPERETDEITGAIKIMASTLGNKLAPKLPRFFDDVIFADRSGKEFFWSTTTMNADLKARNLPLEDKLPPSFVQIVEEWKTKGGIIESSD